MTVSAHTTHVPIIATIGCLAAAAPAHADTRVSWRGIDPSEYAGPGTFVVTGTSLQARATVTVKEEST